MFDFIAQAVGIVGSVVLVLSFQIKNTRAMFAVQCAANLLFCINYLMLGQMTGAVLMFIGMFTPAILILTKGDNKLIKYAVMAVYVLVAVLTYSGVLSVLVCAVQLCFILAQWTYRGVFIRKVRLAASPIWLAYNIFSRSIGAIIAEVFTFISIIIYLLRTRSEGKNE